MAANGNISIVNSGLTANGSVVSSEWEGIETATPGHFVVIAPPVGLGVYNVIGIDYDAYYCAYSCDQLGEFRDQFAWVLSRTPTLPTDVLAAAEAVFTTNNIDVNIFEPTHQGDDCVYPPLPRLT
ncbi:crustacyanin-A2 subunit-like [Hyalella azteca]|uniref:Crustacyanin-A2 subunit-like n=1 Tax=Hyalella azteca TaxID=294128 RepID=A0A979FUV3_HYAAZ|nr:crustacyanin-A2 subunit-like [Hyalella azteca]